MASSPVSSTSPESAASSPAMIRRIVLLPEPDGPSSATSWPAGTSNETPSTAWNEPNRLRRFLTAMAKARPPICRGDSTPLAFLSSRSTRFRRVSMPISSTNDAPASTTLAA